ncbi:MAG: hypothetical protein AAGE18_06805 [Pseudomonadota bacterium]
MTRQELLRQRARANPGFARAAAADARAVAASLHGRRDWHGRSPALLLILAMIWQADGFLALVLTRMATWLRRRSVPVLPTILRRIAITIAQVHIGAPVILGPGIILPHGQVVIDGLVQIGGGAVIRPFVTIGLAEGNIVGPTIGARAVIGTGAKIIGPITIGKDVKIGANAVVIHDVPDGATVVGAPARVVEKAKSGEAAA